MSSDNGWVIRQDSQGLYVLQMYFDSSDSYPDVEGRGYRLSTLQAAVLKYTELDMAEPTEYGLAIVVKAQHPERGKMEIEQFHRKSFTVDAVRVTEENMEEVAKWCDGNVHIDDTLSNPDGSAKFIKVRVLNPLDVRQTQAFVGDWVLYAGKGYKVYKHKAFLNSFVKPVSEPVEQNAFEGSNTVDVGHSTTGANPGGTHSV